LHRNLKFEYEDEINDGYTEYFSLGCDFEGQLGHGMDPTLHDRARFVTVPKSLSFDILIRSVACGGAHTLILSKSGDLFSIGSNEFG
jgi:alpha-tubulin suppressor-like RCC1 family protein